MQRIGVFLSSKAHLPETYVRAAEELGGWIGRKKYMLVYGGARKGLMEVLAQSVKAAGGRVMGVVPQILQQRGWVSDTLDITIPTADLDDRKAVMVRESEVMIALPGGIGTLDEIFTVLAANTIGIHRKRIVLYDVEGCWDTLVKLLDEMAAAGLISDGQEKMLAVVRSVEELENLLKD